VRGLDSPRLVEVPTVQQRRPNRDVSRGAAV